MPPVPASSGPNRGQTRGHNRSIQPLNVSTVSQQSHKLANGGPRMMLNTTPLTSISSSNNNHSHLNLNTKHRIGAREALTSLGLLCLGKKREKLCWKRTRNLMVKCFNFSFSSVSIAFANFFIENFAWRTGSAYR